MTAMVGVAHRSTMDIDATIKNMHLSAEDALKAVNEIKAIDVGDGVTFEVMRVSNIMDDMEYPGIRISLNSYFGKLVTPLKIDISTGDQVTPRETEFHYDLLLEDRSISLWSYNLETILAEKLQTVLARGVLNTRMRDYYDLWMLYSIYEADIDTQVFHNAFLQTCKRRGTKYLLGQNEEILSAIESDEQLRKLWDSYRRKFSYASEITYQDMIDSIKILIALIR